MLSRVDPSTSESRIRDARFGGNGKSGIVVGDGVLLEVSAGGGGSLKTVLSSEREV
jgi:hypothetical protein